MIEFRLICKYWSIINCLYFTLTLGIISLPKSLTWFTWPMMLWPHPFSFSFFFLMWTVFKVFSEFVTMLFLFYVLSFCPQGMWNLCSLIRIKPTLPALEGSLNHRTSREVPWASSLNCLPVVSLSPDITALYWSSYAQTVRLPLGLYVCFQFCLKCSTHRIFQREALFFGPRFSLNHFTYTVKKLKKVCIYFLPLTLHVVVHFTFIC